MWEPMASSQTVGKGDSTQDEGNVVGRGEGSGGGAWSEGCKWRLWRSTEERGRKGWDRNRIGTSGKGEGALRIGTGGWLRSSCR